MWNLILHFLTFAGGIVSGVMLMCLMQTGKLADKEFETMKEERRRHCLVLHLQRSGSRRGRRMDGNRERQCEMTEDKNGL